MSEKAPEFKTGNQSICKALNQVSGFALRHGVNPAGRPGWSESPDGWVPPYIRPGALEAETLWALNIEDAETGEVSVECGTIIEDASDLTGELTITDAESTFTPSANQWIYLKFEDLTTPTCTLTAGGNWTDFPSAYEITNSGSTAEYTAYHYPLYHFRATTAAGYTKINDSLYYLRIAEDTHFMLIHTIYQTGSDWPIAVHKLIPCHRVLPS